jgi:hypothetical protein
LNSPNLPNSNFSPLLPLNRVKKRLRKKIPKTDSAFLTQITDFVKCGSDEKNQQRRKWTPEDHHRNLSKCGSPVPVASYDH